MTIALFLGPSLPLERAREILDGRYLPPARQGDVLRLVREGEVDAIALIDGDDYASGPLVWHKEILCALDRGIPVFGAGALGAIRAAELAPVGMRGFGEVYRLYREGLLEGDDAVAAPFSVERGRYRRLAEPLVNLLATFSRARETGRITGEGESALKDAAEGLFYRDRSIGKVLEKLRADGGIEEKEAAALGEDLESLYVDRLASDAEGLLRHLAQEGPGGPVQVSLPPDWKESHVFLRIVEEERQEVVDDVVLTVGDITAWGALARPEGFDLARRGLNRFLGLELARQRGLVVGDDDVALESTRFRRRMNLVDDEAFLCWMKDNHLDDEGFVRLMRDEATLSRLRHWLFVAWRFGTPVQAMADEMRLEGLYETVSAEAARAYGLFRALRKDVRQEASELGSRDDFFPSYVAAHALASMDRNFLAWCEEMAIDTGRALSHALIREGLRRSFESLGTKGEEV